MADEYTQKTQDHFDIVVKDAVAAEHLDNLIRSAVIAGFKECMAACPYNLALAGITSAQHTDHHLKISDCLKDFSKVRLVLLLMVISTIMAGAGTSLWVGIRHFLGIQH
jgi:hypothetical protein